MAEASSSERMMDDSLHLTRDEHRLVRYLLGLFPEREMARLDELTVVDDHMASRLQDVENDLVDAYVRGTLTGELLTRFESHYLASPRRRERVAFARRFAAAVDSIADAAARGTSPGVSTSGESSETGLVSSAGRRRRTSTRTNDIWYLAVAALLVLTCSIVFFENARLRRRVEGAEQAHAEVAETARQLDAKLLTQQTNGRALADEVRRLQAALQTPSIALVLLPQMRADGVPAAIALREGATAIALELRLDTIREGTRYEVVLADPASNRIVWRAESPDASRGRSSIAVSIPANVLRSQHYAVEVIGHGADGRHELAGSYAFEVRLP
jgi:hypothetical protein